MFPKQERPDAMEEQTVTAEVNIKIETLEGGASDEIAPPFFDNVAVDSSYDDGLSDPHNSSKMVANPAFFKHSLPDADLEASNSSKSNPTGGGSSFKFQGRVPKVSLVLATTIID